MIEMDLQKEKLHLIEQLARLQDANIIKRIKEVLQSSSQELVAGSDSKGKAITQSELIARAEASNRAIKKGKITSIEDLEEESKSW